MVSSSSSSSYSEYGKIDSLSEYVGNDERPRQEGTACAVRCGVCEGEHGRTGALERLLADLVPRQGNDHQRAVSRGESPQEDTPIVNHALQWRQGIFIIMSKKEDIRIEDHKEYVLLKGGEILVLNLDTTDVVTDIDVQGVPVEHSVKGTTESIEFMPRGRDNDLPYEVMRGVLKNVTVSANLEFKCAVTYGEGVQVLRRHRNDAGKIEVHEVLPTEEPEVFEWLENNSFNSTLLETINDVRLFGEAYVQYIFSRDEKSPKLVQVKPLETTCSRLSKIDEKSRRIKWHGYCADWNKRGIDGYEVIATPLLDRNYPFYDIKQRMGLLPNASGQCELGDDRVFVHRLALPTPGRFYYACPYWWSVLLSGWLDFSNSIIEFKKNVIKNEMALKYIVYIQDDFYDKLYKARRAESEEKKKEIRKEFLTNLEAFLTGAENAGNSFVTHFKYDRVKGVTEKDIIIEPVDKDKKGGDYIEDSEESSNVLCYAMGVHSSILGSSPGKSKTINGTEARELFTIQQALAKYAQQLVCQPLYVAKAMNGWPKDLEFAIANLQLTTLDKGTGAVKQTGISPQNTD